jgi:hypothetical protein
MASPMHGDRRGCTVTAGLDGLRTIARKLHAHYDIEPEVVLLGGARRKVGFHVRLWGVHAKGARALPGCSRCRELEQELRRIAEFVVPREERPTRLDFEPFYPALYDSRVVPDADEIALSIRLVHREGYEQPVDACEERCLKEIVARLRELGIPER